MSSAGTQQSEMEHSPLKHTEHTLKRNHCDNCNCVNNFRASNFGKSFALAFCVRLCLHYDSTTRESCPQLHNPSTWPATCHYPSSPFTLPALNCCWCQRTFRQQQKLNPSHAVWHAGVFAFVCIKLNTIRQESEL